MPKPPKAKQDASANAVQRFPLSDLELDADNPRLRTGTDADTQDELLAVLAGEFNPFEVAQSIAKNGYFDSEPLIAVKSGSKLVIVEGNRRLAALKLLARPELAEELELDDADEWYQLAQEADLPDKIPVVVASSRDAVQPLIGYRHISGILPWGPREKARFVAQLVDSKTKSFERAALVVGEPARTVQELYRNHLVGEYLVKKAAVASSKLTRRFGVLTRALQDQRIREFVGVLDVKDVEVGGTPFDTKQLAKAKEFAAWLFAEKPLISDSRMLYKVGRIVADSHALTVLRSSGDLDRGFEAAGGVRDHLLTLLRKAETALETAIGLPRKYRKDAGVRALVETIELRVAELAVETP